MLVGIQAGLVVDLGLALGLRLEALGGLLQDIAYNQLVHLLQLAKGATRGLALGYGVVLDPLIAVAGKVF